MLRHAVDGSLRNLKTRVVSHRVTHGTGGVEHHDDVGRGHGRLRRAGLRAGHVQGQVIGAIIVRLDVLAVPGRRDDRVRHRGTWHLTDRHRLRGRRILLLRHLDLTAIGAHRIRVLVNVDFRHLVLRGLGDPLGVAAQKHGILARLERDHAIGIRGPGFTVLGAGGGVVHVVFTRVQRVILVTVGSLIVDISVERIVLVLVSFRNVLRLLADLNMAGVKSHQIEVKLAVGTTMATLEVVHVHLVTGVVLERGVGAIGGFDHIGFHPSGDLGIRLALVLERLSKQCLQRGRSGFIADKRHHTGREINGAAGGIMDATDIQHKHAVDEQPQIIVTREVERHRGTINEFAFFRLHELRVCGHTEGVPGAVHRMKADPQLTFIRIERQEFRNPRVSSLGPCC